MLFSDTMARKRVLLTLVVAYTCIGSGKCDGKVPNKAQFVINTGVFVCDQYYGCVRPCRNATHCVSTCMYVYGYGVDGQISRDGGGKIVNEKDTGSDLTDLTRKDDRGGLMDSKFTVLLDSLNILRPVKAERQQVLKLTYSMPITAVDLLHLNAKAIHIK